MDKFYRSDFIDNGTFGRVYKMSCKDGQRAVKKYTEKDGLSAGIINELLFLARIQHKNIVEKLEIITEDNIIYLVMPYYSMTLFNWAKKAQKEMTMQEYTSKIEIIIDGVLAGLEQMHRNFYIHGDIKPTNIMLDVAVTDVKIIDFGFSFNEVIINKHTLHDIQTIWYRAPEVLKKHKYDYKIDIWSLGLIYLELLSAQTILAGKDEEQQLKLIQNFNMFDFIIDKFKNPAEIFHQTKRIHSMLCLIPEMRYGHVNMPEYNLDYIINNETCYDDLYKNLPKKITPLIINILFSWMTDFMRRYDNYDILIYAFHIVIAYLAQIEISKLNPDLQLIAVAAITIADCMLSTENFDKEKLIKKYEDLSLSALINTEYEILIKLGGKLHMITPLNAIHFYRQQYSDLYAEKSDIINNLICQLHITGDAFIYKPSYLVKSVFDYVANKKINDDILSVIKNTEKLHSL